MNNKEIPKNRISIEILQQMRINIFEEMLNQLEKVDKSKHSDKIKYELKYKIASKYVTEVKKLDNKIRIENKKLLMR